MTVNKQPLLKINLHYRNTYYTRLSICQKKFRTCKNYKNQTGILTAVNYKNQINFSSSLNVTVLFYQMWFKYEQTAYLIMSRWVLVWSVSLIFIIRVLFSGRISRTTSLLHFCQANDKFLNTQLNIFRGSNKESNKYHLAEGIMAAIFFKVLIWKGNAVTMRKRKDSLWVT